MPYYKGKVVQIGIFDCSEKQKASIPDNITHNIAVRLGPNDIDPNTAVPPNFMTVRTVEKKPEFDLTWDVKKDDQYVTVLEGATIEFMYEPNGQYWKPDKKTIKLLENGTTPPKSYTYHKAQNTSSGGQSTNTNPTSQNTPFYDTQGAKKGNCFNNAMILVGYNNTDPNIVALMKQLWAINHEVDQETDVKGETVGMAITNACHITRDITKVKSMALSLINSYIKEMDEWVSGGCKDNATVPDDSIPF